MALACHSLSSWRDSSDPRDASPSLSTTSGISIGYPNTLKSASYVSRKSAIVFAGKSGLFLQHFRTSAEAISFSSLTSGNSILSENRFCKNEIKLGCIFLFSFTNSPKFRRKKDVENDPFLDSDGNSSVSSKYFCFSKPSTRGSGQKPFALPKHFSKLNNFSTLFAKTTCG